ncbi:MAG: helix-turn-helix transcriptional regulator [Verrucomicrobiota bacterium]
MKTRRFESFQAADYTSGKRRLISFASEQKTRHEATKIAVKIRFNAMAIIINIDVILAKRKMSVTELAEKVGITMANISVLKNGKAKAVRLSTLEAICKALECQPGDILEYEK